MKNLILTCLVASACFWAGSRYASRCPSKPMVSEPTSLTSATQEKESANRATMLSEIALPRLGEGARISADLPNITLINQHGKELKFVDDLVQDRITCTFFFYTNCQGTCPGTVQKVRALRDRVASEFPGTDVAFIGITLDPEHDSTEVLREYSEAVLAEDSNPHPWHFCTGTKDDLEALRIGLGLYDLNPEIDSDRTQHAAMVVIGNDLQNRWVTMPSGLSSEALAETFLRMAGQTEKQRFSMTYATTAVGTSEAQASPPTCCQKKCCESTAKVGEKSEAEATAQP